MLPESQAYRRDIDGLRAIAVLFVILYHAYPNDLSGGFIGVDIFFVISGYLISRGILASLVAGSFSIASFYQSRVRRIFPALIVVLFFVLVVGWFLMLDRDYMALGKHIASGAGFVANIALWLESGYFDSAAEKKPLLHLWSLGVEEQFYLLFPFLLWAVHKANRRALPYLVAILGISFAFNLISVSDRPAMAFYLPHARFWELLAGAVLVCVERGAMGGPGRYWLNELRSIGGAGLLAAGIAFIDEQRTFPGWWAVLPVVGAILLISARDSWVNRHVLASRALVGVGLISYPLYLWHWVLLSFCHLFEDSYPFHETRNPALILSFLLAWLTYLYVEKPIRFGSLKNANAFLLLFPMGVLLVAGLGVYASRGVPDRTAAHVEVVNSGDIGHDEFNSYMARKFFPCPVEWGEDVIERGVVSRCMRSSDHEPPDIVLLGDSHAEHLFIGLAEAFPEHSFVYSTREGLPLVSSPGYKALFEQVVGNRSLGTVVLAAHWASKLRVVDPIRFERELEETIKFLSESKLRIMLLDDVPIFPINPEVCAYGDRLWIRNVCVVSRSKAALTSIDMGSIAARLNSKYPALSYVDLSSFFCDAGSCYMAKEGRLFFRDRNHLNINGSQYVGESLRRCDSAIFRRDAGTTACRLNLIK